MEKYNTGNIKILDKIAVIVHWKACFYSYKFYFHEKWFCQRVIDQILFPSYRDSSCVSFCSNLKKKSSAGLIPS